MGTYVDQTNALIGRVAKRDLIPHAIRRLAEGEPVALERLARAAGWSVDDVEAALDAQVSAERDGQGRLVGRALTLRPTRHRFTVDGRRLFAWCASDGLMLAVILGRPGVVESTCAQTGRPIRVEAAPDGVRRVDPPTAVVPAVRPVGELAVMRADTREHGHFFGSMAATAAWSEAHPEWAHPPGRGGVPARPTGHRAPRLAIDRTPGGLTRPGGNDMNATAPSSPATAPRHTLSAAAACGRIGPIGAAARLVVGTALIVLALVWREPHWRDAALGLLAFPGVITTAFWLRARVRPAAVRAIGPIAQVLNIVIATVLFALPATAGPTFVFYGTSMLVAALRRAGGCEVTAISNVLLRRDDQIGCMVFAPVDLAEAQLRRSP